MRSRNTEHFIPAQIQASDCFGYDRGGGKQKCKQTVVNSARNCVCFRVAQLWHAII